MKNRKIGILTYFKVINYGAVLQAYALFNKINSFKNIDVELINYTHKVFLDKFSNSLYVPSRGGKGNFKHLLNFFILRRGVLKSNKFSEFISTQFSLSKFVNDVSDISNDYTDIIIGSDQVWNIQYTLNEFDDNFLLKSVTSPSVNKIAFASSAGSTLFTDDQLSYLCSSLESFKFIAVREKSLKDQLDTKIKGVNVVLDPTFLLNKNDWNKAFKLNLSGLKSKKYVLIYTFDNDVRCFEIAHKVARYFGYEVYSISSKYFKNKYVDKQLSSLSPSEFLRYFFNANFVITNSFHGTCFSLNFQIPFYSIRKNNNPTRVYDLLSTLNLEDRLISSITEVRFDNVDDYSEQLEIERLKSLQLLTDCLNNEN